MVNFNFPGLDWRRQCCDKMETAHYINLDCRVDRRIRFEKHWGDMFSLTRFSAIKNSILSGSSDGGIRGCGASHATIILEMEKSPEIPFVIVFEDDAESMADFRRLFPEILKYAKSHLGDWDIINCGTNTVFGIHPEIHLPPTLKRVTPNLISTTLWSNTQMMIYGRGAIPIAREYLNAMTALQIPMNSHYSHNDVYFSTHPAIRSWITCPQLTHQYVDWSDNQELLSDQRATFARAAVDLQKISAMLDMQSVITFTVVPRLNYQPHPSIVTTRM